MTHWSDELASSPGFCTMPFFHAYIGQSSKANVCCNNMEYDYGNIDQSSFNHVMGKYNIKLTDFRRQFINANELPETCKLCKNPVGNVYRQKHIDKTKHILKNFDSIDDLINNEQVYTYDIRFSNLCNLQCHYCNPEFSSRFASKLYRAGRITKVFESISDSNVNDILKKVEDSIEHIVEFYFAGGEPLIMKEHYDVLDICLKHNKTDVNLVYSSNLTRLETKHYNVLDYWNQFDSVNLNASIDAGWDQFEFIRDGGVWNDVLENCKKIRSLKNIKFGLAPVIAFWNIISFPKLYIYLVENNLLDRSLDFRGLQVLSYDHLKPAVLPRHFKDRVTEIYNTDYKDYPELHGLLQYLEEDLSHLLPKTKKYVMYQSKLKKCNFYSTFPELNGVFDNV